MARKNVLTLKKQGRKITRKRIPKRVQFTRRKKTKAAKKTKEEAVSNQLSTTEATSSHQQPIPTSNVEPFSSTPKRTKEGKLIASVAPLRKVSRPSNVALTPSTRPIILLPVTIRPDSGRSEIPLLLQPISFKVTSSPTRPSPSIFPQIIPETNSNGPQWAQHLSPMVRSINMGRGNLLNKQSSNLTNCEGQTEPLNLKMGETTVFASPVSVSTHDCPKTKLNSKPNSVVDSTCQPLNLETKKTAASLSLTLQRSNAARNEKVRCKKLSKVMESAQDDHEDDSTSRESCSSPDFLDDIQERVPSKCRRKQIDLRSKAAPSSDTKLRRTEVKVEQSKKKPPWKPSAPVYDVTSTDDEDDDCPLAEILKRIESQTKKDRKNKLVEKEPLMTSSSALRTNNGWKVDGKPYMAFAYDANQRKHIRRQCFPSIVRSSKDDYDSVVMVQDCVYIKAADDHSPYIARVAAIWIEETNKQLMMSIIWYYRAEHVLDPRLRLAPSKESMAERLDSNSRSGGWIYAFENELFASYHQDNIIVDCVEDRCHVVSYLHYCRIKARIRSGLNCFTDDLHRIVPHQHDGKRQTLFMESPPSDSNIYFSRSFYDVIHKRVLKFLPSYVDLVKKSCFTRSSRRKKRLK